MWKRSSEKWVSARLHSTTGRREWQLNKLPADLSLDKQILEGVLKQVLKPSKSRTMVTYLVGENYQLYLHLADLTKDQLGQERIEQLKGLSLDSRLKNVKDWDELAITLGGSWQEKKGELEKLRLLINNNLTIANLKKGGSWEEKTGELLQKRTRVLLAVLLFTILPISIEELTDILGYKKKDSLRDGYLNPLRSHKLIEYTIAQANSPNQQYRITQRGINFIMGSVI